MALWQRARICGSLDMAFPPWLWILSYCASLSSCLHVGSLHARVHALYRGTVGLRSHFRRREKRGLRKAQRRRVMGSESTYKGKIEDWGHLRERLTANAADLAHLEVLQTQLGAAARGDRLRATFPEGHSYTSI